MEHSVSNFLANWRVDYSTAVSGICSDTSTLLLEVRSGAQHCSMCGTIQYNEHAMTTPPNSPILDNTNLVPV